MLKIKKKWLTALRSGKYKQGKNYLRKGDRYCCLGVLCDIYMKDHKDVKWKKVIESIYTCITNNAVLPTKVMTWAGLYDENPYVDNLPLSEINDSGKGFKTIAKLIEENL